MTRICRECGVDLSSRGNRAIRCEECQKKRLSDNRKAKKIRTQFRSGPFFIDKEGDFQHISSNKGLMEQILNEECKICHIDDLLPMIELRNNEIRAIRHYEIPFALKQKALEEVKRLNNKINSLKRQIKIILDWQERRLVMEHEYWKEKTEEYLKDQQRADYDFINEEEDEEEEW